jgi:hypothetical protein
VVAGEDRGRFSGDDGNDDFDDYRYDDPDEIMYRMITPNKNTSSLVCIWNTASSNERGVLSSPPFRPMPMPPTAPQTCSANK